MREKESHSPPSECVGVRACMCVIDTLLLCQHVNRESDTVDLLELQTVRAQGILTEF